MQDLYQHFGDRSLWAKYDVLKSPVVEVTEVWVHDHDTFSSSIVESRTVSSVDIESWLEETPQRCFPAGVYTRALRLVWVGQDTESARVSPSTTTLERLTGAWGLREAFEYSRSCFAGVSALRLQGDAQAFTVTYHPKLAAAWSVSRSGPDGPPQTHAIVFAEGEERVELRRILTSKWSAASASHAMFPALLCSLLLAHELDSTLDDIKAAVREVEAHTGHHRFTSRRQTQPAAGELGHLSAQMSGCAAKLANGTRKMKLVEAINDFMHLHASQGQATTKSQTHAQARIYVPNTESNSDVDVPCQETLSTHHMELLRHRVQMQAVDTAYVQQRVQIQIAALFHLIAQQDNAIAFDTASATRSLAASSLQDSSSMKMLALVAMFFLPGSFVAALFSTPLFVWDDALARGGGISVGTRPQFALFWAVTVPLTVSVFVVYGLWVRVQNKREARERGGRDRAMSIETV